jgi:ankyrin repeat protein
MTSFSYRRRTLAAHPRLTPCARAAAIAAFVVLSAAAPRAAGPDLRLVEAAKARDLAGVAALVKQRVDVNTPHQDGATALHWAAHWNDVKMAALLVGARARVDATNDYGVTPLSLACADAGGEMVELLLKAGANPNGALPTGETPLMTAVRANNLPAVRSLLARKADVNAREASRGQTALMWAFSRGHLDAAKTLLEAGADPRAKSTAGFSPLLFAARTGNIEAVSLLLDRGADANETAADGSSVLHVAVVRGHVPLAEFLLSRRADPNASSAGYTPLHWAAGTWDSQTTHEYLTSPPQPHAVHDEWRALIGLQGDNKLRMVASLLAHGANPNARTTKLPPRFGYSFQSFIRAGGGSIGMTPFAVAAQAGDAPVMRLLVAGGADPLLATEDKSTPLMIASGMTLIEEEMSTPEDRRLEAVKVALALGNDLNAANDLGNTALHATALLGFPTIAEYLVTQGAALDPVNKNGETPLRIAEGTIINAMFFIHDTVVKKLKELGARSDGTGVCTPGIKERASVTSTLCDDAPPPAGAPAKQ